MRLTDYERQPLPGFDAPSRAIGGDHLRHEVTWEGRQVTDLQGCELRLEFEMKGVVDLYSFCFEIDK
ncbi:MAG: hypothetical protein HOC74_27495 [Gemmatimonadetes bacterium]|nr:hypothetical protein [Gemmatimonadota bacterium]